MHGLATQTKNHSTQYTIYIYHKTQTPEKQAKWEKIRESKSIKNALKYAKVIHRRGKYEKIEIKKKFFCPIEKKIVGKTIRIVEQTETMWEGLVKNMIARAQNT